MGFEAKRCWVPEMLAFISAQRITTVNPVVGLTALYSETWTAANKNNFGGNIPGKNFSPASEHEWKSSSKKESSGKQAS